jgi:primosomal protein N' (replication factor Y)
MTPAGSNGEERVPIAFPGPWWTCLTYIAPRGAEVKPGVRVRAPMGRGTRVGIVMNPGELDGGYSGELREIAEVIDEVPALSEAEMKLLGWFCGAYLCGFGAAIKTLLPAGFIEGKKIDPPMPEKKTAPRDDASFVYEPVDSVRFERYASMLPDGIPSLVSFPLYPDAKKFFEYLQNSSALSDEIKKNTALYPRLGGSAEWKMWARLRSPGYDTAIVVGGQNSAMAPLGGAARFIVDDESNNAWRTMRPPVFNVRSLIASRARITGASLVLGGRMPSARAFSRYEEKYAGRAPDPRAKSENKIIFNKTIFVDMKLAYTPSVEGVIGGLAVSEPLVRETEAAISRGEWALWILDRKGYAGEIICEECNANIKCAKCGGAMRVESANLRCVSCGAEAKSPDACPNCAGRLLSARRPGLDALLPLADAAVVSPVPILSPADDEETVRRTMANSRSAVVIGTRAALALCDEVPVGMVGWIDADGEARSEEHDARQRAFSLIWESRWRGLAPQNRSVLVQTRRPASDWQRGLERGDGWKIFWRSELRDRAELSMPPFSSLVHAEGAAQDIARVAERADGMGLEYWSPDGEGGNSSLWIRTKKISALRKIFEPCFRIGMRRKYPSITVWHE